MQELTVKELRDALEGVPDDLPVRLESDSGVDQGFGEIIVESARRVTYGSEDYFSIYANDHADPEEVDVSQEELRRLNEMVDEVNEILKNKKALKVLKMLRDYVNENWDEEYRHDIDDVNEMYNYLIPIISNSNIVGSAIINGKSYLISEGTINEQ